MRRCLEEQREEASIVVRAHTLVRWRVGRQWWIFDDFGAMLQRPRGLVKELHEPVWWEPECFGEQEDKGVAQLSDLNEILSLDRAEARKVVFFWLLGALYTRLVRISRL